MTTRVRTEGSIVGSKHNLAVTGIAICVLLLGEFVVHEDEVLSVVAAVRAHIRQIQQLTTDAVPRGHDGYAVALGATDRKKVALGSLVTPIVTAETPG